MNVSNIIQVGVAGMGAVWVKAVADSPHWQPAAYVDVNPDALAQAAKATGLPKSRCFNNLDDALAKIEADALLDVTPQKFRKSVCLAAFKRGLHVLSEKPLADTLKNAEAIVAAAAKARRTYMVAQNYRYQKLTRAAQHYIQNGALGDLGYVGITFHKGPHFGGFREEMAYPLVLDMSIHHFDMLRCMTGRDIVSVQALSIDAPWNWNKGDATVMAQLSLDGGVAANYFGSWVARGAETAWNAEWRFAGSAGTLEWVNEKLRFSDETGHSRRVPAKPLRAETQLGLLDDFARALDTGEEPETSGRRNLNSLAATHAVVRSIRTGQPVHVASLLAGKA